MWPAIISLLSGIPGLFGEYFKKRSELEELKLETAKQLELARMGMAKEIARNETERANNSLGATSAKFKYLTYFIFFAPFVACLIGFPEYADQVFKNLNTLPEWYVTAAVATQLTIWGIPIASNVVSGIFSNLSSAMDARRQFKLEKATIDKKAFYEALRAIKGHVSAEDVKINDKVLDKLND